MTDKRDPHCGCTLAEHATCILMRLQRAERDCSAYRLPPIVIDDTLRVALFEIAHGGNVPTAARVLDDAETILDAHITARTAMLEAATRPPTSNTVH